MQMNLIIVALVLALSLVQSLFGVGLLVFGTPLLLMMGVPFEEALGVLLPCSIAVSLIQTAKAWDKIDIRRSFAQYCLPGVIICLALVLWLKHSFNIRVAVGCLMLLTALVRISARTNLVLQTYCRRHQHSALVIIGILHGFTNMGGGLLSAFVSSFHQDKAKIRANIAFGYLLMAVCQLTVLLASGAAKFGPLSVVLPLLAGATFLLIGNRIFLAASEPGFQKAFTAFISILGAALLLT
jgi:uncharacterized protein